MDEPGRSRSGAAPAPHLDADLAAVGRGDMDALSRVYHATSGRLLAVCQAVTGDRGAAEDVLQETFIKIWNRAAGFDPARASGATWLASIARNSAIDWHRAHARHRSPGAGDALLPYAEALDPAATAEEYLIQTEREHHAVVALNELPDGQDEDIRDIFLKGLTYRELALDRGESINTVKSRVRRGLLKLRSTFDGA